MKITKSQLRSIIKEEKQKLIAETRIRKAVGTPLLNENWWMSQSLRPPSYSESANSEYNTEAKKTGSVYFEDNPEKRHLEHVASADKGLVAMFIRMQLQDVSEAGLKPEEIEQLKSLQANRGTGREDIPYMYPAIVDRLDFHDLTSQRKFKPIADKRKKDAEAARAKRQAEEEAEDRKRAERAAKRKRNKSGKAYDKYLQGIAKMQRNMDAVDEMNRHVRAIAKAGGSVGEMAEDFIEEILEPSINYNDDDINSLLRQLDGEVKDAIMKKFNPSSNIDELDESKKMKITKRQLKRIIKEEKEKLLVEMNPMMNAERASGSFANTSTVERVTDGILDLLQEIEMGSSQEEGLEGEEAEEFARNGAILVVAQAFQSAGLMDVYMSLTRMLR